jgi:NAD-dependent SIR2 family protein deacetylase
MLRQWGESRRHGYLVFTSNVDGHFHKAGYAPERIAECHGSIHELQCLHPCSQALWPAAPFQPDVDEARCELSGPAPACPVCGGMARPNILLFNDSGWIGTRYERHAMFRQAWIERLRRPVVIEIGAGVGLPAVRQFSARMVLQHNAALIRINPHQPHIGNLPGVGIAAGALQVLGAIDALLGITLR